VVSTRTSNGARPVGNSVNTRLGNYGSVDTAAVQAVRGIDEETLQLLSGLSPRALDRAGEALAPAGERVGIRGDLEPPLPGSPRGDRACTWSRHVAWSRPSSNGARLARGNGALLPGRRAEPSGGRLRKAPFGTRLLTEAPPQSDRYKPLTRTFTRERATGVEPAVLSLGMRISLISADFSERRRTNGAGQTMSPNEGEPGRTRADVPLDVPWVAVRLELPSPLLGELNAESVRLGVPLDALVAGLLRQGIR
jgi:hypothetical protein